MTPNKLRMSPDTLADRCEKASANEQRLLIIEAAEACMMADGVDADTEDTMGQLDRLEALLEVGAYLDAATTLVPDGCRWTMDSWTFGWSAGIWRPVNNDWLFTSHRDRQAATPALALCAAALRARQS